MIERSPPGRRLRGTSRRAALGTLVLCVSRRVRPGRSAGEYRSGKGLLNLEAWARRGVMLLNARASLTDGANVGWQTFSFTDTRPAVIRVLKHARPRRSSSCGASRLSIREDKRAVAWGVEYSGRGLFTPLIHIFV